MNKLCYFLAFDLGATSGRSILATLQEGKICIEELTRFPNRMLRINQQYYWNIYALFEELENALCAVVQRNIELSAIGIDTWGVDFVYLAADGTMIGLPRAYRDPYTANEILEQYFTQISREKIYKTTGIQIMNINSLFQLYAAKNENSFAFKSADSILFMPDALIYLLTNKKVCEYSIASTSQLLNVWNRKFEEELFEPFGKKTSIIPELVMPGTLIGNLSEAIQKECGIPAVPVVAVAGHDTASAIAAVPAESENFAYLSSGTWSLMGIETKNPIVSDESFRLNFTNEGGVDGTIRFLKNITGMWLLEQCRKEWDLQGESYSYSEIVDFALSVPDFPSLIDPDAECFANPESMTQAITDYCRQSHQKPPESVAEFIRCIFNSMVAKYKQVLNHLQVLAPFKIDKLHIIGGGSQNRLLNQLTANAIGIPVVAGPSEATAIGNVMMQAKALGLVRSLPKMRKIIRNSIELETFYPEKQ